MKPVDDKSGDLAEVDDSDAAAHSGSDAAAKKRAAPPAVVSTPPQDTDIIPEKPRDDGDDHKPIIKDKLDEPHNPDSPSTYMRPDMVCKFLSNIDKDKDGGGARFMKTISTVPWHPVVKCVLTRKPYSRKEVLELSRLFLHWCSGCGKSKAEVTLTRCSGCEVAYYCSEKCARRASKRHHADMCGRLRELHDEIMPSMVEANKNHEKRVKAKRNRDIRFFLGLCEKGLWFAAAAVLLIATWQILLEASAEQELEASFGFGMAGNNFLGQ